MMMAAKMDPADEDLRSIEAENVGDDDELDADLEREFLLQQEAKGRDAMAEGPFRPRSTDVDEEADDGEFGSGEIRRWRQGSESEYSNSDCRGGLGSKLGRVEWNHEMGMRNLSDTEECLFLGGPGELITRPEVETMQGTTSMKKRVLVDKLTLFPIHGGDLSMGNNAMDGVELTDNGGGFSISDGKTELFDTQFQVPLVKEEAKWLGLGPPSNSYSAMSCEKVVPKFLKRKIVSGSSSKGTSLERQYSTGSTSTVESPHFVVQERKGIHRPRQTREVHSSGAPRLTFSFPGWGVDISKGEKHPSVVSHHHAEAAPAAIESLERPLKRQRDDLNCSSSSAAGRGKIVEEDLGNRIPVWELPDEILLQVMRRLEIKDLCSAVQTCKRWYGVGLQNDLWEHLIGDSDCGQLSDSSSDVLPRWLCKKNLILSENVRMRFNVFSKGYDYLQRALHEWWNNGLQNSRHPSRGMYSLIRKLTDNDWSLLYEALGVFFMDRTDRIANMLLRKLRPAGRLTRDGTSSEPVIDEKRDSNVDSGSSGPLHESFKSSYSLGGSSSDFGVHWKSGSVIEVSEVEGVLGKELWELLLKSWKRFKAWLLLISSHCPDLNNEVVLERARSFNRPATPTVYEQGLICFRSQVVLRYRLRNVLQAGFMFLTTQDARDCMSEHDMDLLRSLHHLLQELDVPDDFTLPPKNHTQTKLRHCFRSALSTNSKLALHMMTS